MLEFSGRTERLHALLELLAEESERATDFQPLWFPVYRADKVNPNSVMEIGYIVRKNIILSQMGEMYVKEIRRYLGIKDD